MNFMMNREKGCSAECSCWGICLQETDQQIESTNTGKKYKLSTQKGKKFKLLKNIDEKFK